MESYNGLTASEVQYLTYFSIVIFKKSGFYMEALKAIENAEKKEIDARILMKILLKKVSILAFNKN